MYQLLGLNTLQAYQNVQSEGLSMLYRGVKPPLLSAAVSKSIMFGLYKWYDQLLVDRYGNHKLIHLSAAMLSGTTEALLTPFEVSFCLCIGCINPLSLCSYKHSVAFPAIANAAADPQVQRRDHWRVRCTRAHQQVRTP